MTIEELRTDIRAWLDGYLHIQEWDLDTPSNSPRVIDGKRYPANSAIEMPMENLSVELAAGRTLARAILPYVIVWRFRGQASQDQLPVKQVESMLAFLAFDLVTNYRNVSDLIESAAIQNSETPIRIGRTDGEDADWLVALYMEMRLTFVLEFNGIDTILAPPVAPYDGFTVQSIGLNVNRSLAATADPNDPDDYVLDETLQILLGD